MRCDGIKRRRAHFNWKRSQHILRYAKCDVLIVRTPKEAEEESKPLQVELTE